MELLLIALLWIVILYSKTEKPLSEQTRNELTKTKNENIKKIGKLEYALKDAETKVNQERSKFSEIKNNPEKPFRLDRRINRIVNISLFTMASLFVLISALPFIDPIYLPQSINNFLQENTALFELLKGILLLHLTAVLIILIIYIFVKIIQRIMVNTLRNMGLEQSYKTKLTPMERFLEEKRDALKSFERRYDEYVKEKETMIQDLKIKNIEIDELINKKENLIKGV